MIKQILNYYKASIEDLIVIYDDIDLPLGTIRFRDKGGPAGHRGIENIIYQLGSESFIRLRLGIAIEGLHMRPSERYVLSPFPKEYKDEIDLVMNKSVDGLEYLLDNGIVKTMNEFNQGIKLNGAIYNICIRSRRISDAICVLENKLD